MKKTDLYIFFKNKYIKFIYLNYISDESFSRIKRKNDAKTKY